MAIFMSHSFNRKKPNNTFEYDKAFKNEVHRRNNAWNSSITTVCSYLYWKESRTSLLTKLDLLKDKRKEFTAE